MWVGQDVVSREFRRWISRAILERRMLMER
jgi:hypothetical protein